MKESILQRHDGGCWLCEAAGDYRIHPVLHKHHVFGGPNRQISEREGFFVWLCPHHHTGDAAGCRDAVHFNPYQAQLLHEACQREFEKKHSREEFMRLIGRNYLGGDMETGTTVRGDL